MSIWQDVMKEAFALPGSKNLKMKTEVRKMKSMLNSYIGAGLTAAVVVASTILSILYIVAATKKGEERNSDVRNAFSYASFIPGFIAGVMLLNFFYTQPKWGKYGIMVLVLHALGLLAIMMTADASRDAHTTGHLVVNILRTLIMGGAAAYTWYY